MKKTRNDPGAKVAATKTVAAWASLLSRAPSDTSNVAYTSPSSRYGAEAEFTLIDDEIHAKYDAETGHHQYAGTIPEVIGSVERTGHLTPGQYQARAAEALALDERLEHVIVTYHSPLWAAEGLARQGSLYDTLRTGLASAGPPAVQYFTPTQEALLQKLSASSAATLQGQAQDLRAAVIDGWNRKRDIEIAAADSQMVRRYARAIAIADRWRVRGPGVVRAVQRLAYFTGVLGDEKMRAYVTHVKDPADPTNATNLTYTDQMYVQAAGLLPAPAR
jgi:hypothetical protein